MENRLLTQFNNVISSQWELTQVEEPYEPTTKRELFELAYHTCNSITMRTIFLRLVPTENESGSKAIMYSKSKKFIEIEALPTALRISKYFPSGSSGDKLINEIHPRLKSRKEKFFSKDKDLKVQILKMIIVERKLDECANNVMLKDTNRKIYFSIGDARETAAVIPLFMESEGASLVQLALNKWMTTIQNLNQEQNFPENLMPGLLKNLMQIKKWVLNLISKYIDE